MTPEWLGPAGLLLAAGAALGGFVQGVSGFAFGMVAMSVWVWGIDPRIAATLSVFGGLTGQTFQAVTHRRPVHWPVLMPFLVGAALGLPLGMLLLPHLDPALFKRLLGWTLLFFCPLMIWAHGLPGLRVGGRWADGVAGAMGGVMGALGGFTGVAPAIWCTVRGYDKDVQRAVLQNFNLVALAATFTALIVAGVVTRDMLPAMAIVAPALLLPSVWGARVYVGLSPLAFRRVVLALLTAAGLAMVWATR